MVSRAQVTSALFCAARTSTLPQLSTWRRQRDQGALEALSRPRGRKPAEAPLAAQIAELRRRLTRRETQLEKARRVIAVQGNFQRTHPQRAVDSREAARR